MKRVIFSLFPVYDGRHSNTEEEVKFLWDTTLNIEDEDHADTVVEVKIKECMELLDVYSNNDWKVYSVKDIPRKEYQLCLYTDSEEYDLDLEAESRYKDLQELQSHDLIINELNNSPITKEDIVVAEDGKSVDISVGTLDTINLNLSSVYAMLQKNKLINADNPFDKDSRITILSDSDNSKIFEWVGYSYYSMVANAINIYDNSKLDGRSPGIYDMPEAGFIISYEGSEDNAVIFLADRKRQMMFKIYVKELLKSSFNSGKLIDNKVAIREILHHNQLKLNK